MLHDIVSHHVILFQNTIQYILYDHRIYRSKHAGIVYHIILCYNILYYIMQQYLILHHKIYRSIPTFIGLSRLGNFLLMYRRLATVRPINMVSKKVAQLMSSWISEEIRQNRETIIYKLINSVHHHIEIKPFITQHLFLNSYCLKLFTP